MKLEFLIRNNKQHTHAGFVVAFLKDLHHVLCKAMRHYKIGCHSI